MLEIKTVKKGAELVSIKIDGVEKMHDGENFWNRHSPVLFPIVGKLKDGKTIIDGNEYQMGQHGFARDMEFEEISNNSYVLKANDETYKKYPYNFELYISYEVNKKKVTTKYKVVNKDSKEMIFGLGGHPAFACEYTSGKYRLEFEDIEDKIEIYQLEDGLVKENPEKQKVQLQNVHAKAITNHKLEKTVQPDVLNVDFVQKNVLKVQLIFLLVCLLLITQNVQAVANV